MKTSVKCYIETRSKYRIYSQHEAYVAILQYIPHHRKYHREFILSLPKVWITSRCYWTAWHFEAVPGMVLECRLKAWNQEKYEYFRITSRKGFGREWYHLKRINKVQAHRYAVSWARKFRWTWRKFRHIPAHLKVQVYARDRGRCTLCGSPQNLEYDHILPISKGGATSLANLQLLCRDCNRQKGNQVIHPQNRLLSEVSHS